MRLFLNQLFGGSARTLSGFLALVVVLLGAERAVATIIPADRTVPWVPGVTVGVRGGIPRRTNLLDVTRYGATTNNGSVKGSISSGSTQLSVSAVGDFAVGQGVWVSDILHTTIVGISGNTFTLHDAAPSAVSGARVAHDNAPVINAVIQQAQSNDVVYVPNGTFVTRMPIYLQNKSYISLRGDTNSVLACLGAGGSGVLVGPTLLQPSQAKQFTVVGGVGKGANQMTLTSTLYAPFSDSIRVGELYSLSTLNGNDPNFRVISVYGYQRVVSQVVSIESIAGNTITFSPPAAWFFTNQPSLVQLTYSAGRGIGIENLGITVTNAGETASLITDTIFTQGLVDSWVTGVSSTYANNYNLHVQGCVHCDFDGNAMRFMLSQGTSHAGLLVEQSSGCLFQDNIFDTLDFGLQLWGSSTMGCAFFANLWTNSINQAILFHNTHHMMDLFEANVIDSSTESDGYYGSNSHETFFRNQMTGSLYLKRFTSFINTVGNVLGTPSVNFAYDSLLSPSFNPWPLFEFGYPNIGNHSYTGNAPPMAWNYPQTSFYGNHGSSPYLGRYYTNCSYKFTSTLVNVTNLVGNFSAWPYDPYGGYSLVFQDGVNTNIYHTLADTLPPGQGGSLHASSPPTSTGMALSAPMTISNGWTMYVSSADTYQQLQSIDIASDIRHGNYVYTNNVGVLVWDQTISDTLIPPSLLYPSGAPSWWGTNRWPAIDPVAPTLVAPIPAQLRYLGISSGNNGSSRPTPPTGLHVTF